MTKYQHEWYLKNKKREIERRKIRYWKIKNTPKDEFLKMLDEKYGDK